MVLRYTAFFASCMCAEHCVWGIKISLKYHTKWPLRNERYFRFFMKCFRFPSNWFVAFTLLRFCFNYDLSFSSQTLIQSNKPANKQKKLTKSTRDRSRSFSYRCIHMHWMTIAHTLLHSLDLRKLNQNDLEFRLARKPYDYFLFGGITNLYENNYVSTCVRAVRNAHCLRIDFRRISVAASRRNTRTKEITERKPLKTPMLSNSVRRLFSVHFSLHSEENFPSRWHVSWVDAFAWCNLSIIIVYKRWT